MVEPARNNLLEILVANYDDFRRRLARHFGSADIAADALQDTALAVLTMVKIGPVANPTGYLYSIASRSGRKVLRLQKLHQALSSDTVLGDVSDSRSEEDQIAEMELSHGLIRHLLRRLPERRRAIVTSIMVDQRSAESIASEFNITSRTVRREVKAVIDECASHVVDNKVVGAKPRHAREKKASDGERGQRRGSKPGTPNETDCNTSAE